MQEPRHVSCLLLILDLNPYCWGDRTFKRSGSDASSSSSSSSSSTTACDDDRKPQIGLAKFLSVLVVFLNAYRLMHRDAHIRVIGSHLKGATLLLDNSRPASFRKQLAAEIQNLAKLYNPPAEYDPHAGPTEIGSKLGAALSLSLCIANKLIREDVAPRILVFMASPDVSKQYISVMNCIFSAQKLKIMIDSCVLYKKDSSLLQQAAYITGGVYLRPVLQEKALIEYLLCAFLPDADTRQYLKVPVLQKIDFQASCFCHKQPKDVAFVCSVCLSIFCTFIPICPTCRVKFPFQLQS